MSQQELLIRVADALDDAGVEYMVTGSVVSSLQGEPRASHDVDLVVAFPSEAVPRVLAAFPEPDYYLSDAAMRSAIERGGMFNLLSLTTGDKVDFWLLTGSEFDQSRFGRRVAETIGGRTLWVSSPEDTILAKLRWTRDLGGSEKQMTDVLRVYEVQRAGLDLDYLNRWAEHLGLQDLWQQIQQSANDTD
jgi:hypothetical protein